VLIANALLATAMPPNKLKLLMAALVILAFVDPTANVVSARKSPRNLLDVNVVTLVPASTANAVWARRSLLK